MVEVENVYKSFGKKKVLMGANINIDKGEIVGLVGKNGAGKTTLIKIISGLIFAQKGEINSNNEKVMAFIEQPAFFQDMTGRENLEYFLGRVLTEEEIEQAPFKCGEFVDTPIKKYSMGMKQKMALWMMSLSDAEYLLFDEPSVALDVETVKEFDDLLISIKKEKGILVSSHNFSELQNICDRVIVLNNGLCHKEILMDEMHRNVYLIKVLNAFDEDNMLFLNEENVTVSDNEIEFVGTLDELADFNYRLVNNNFRVYEIIKKYEYLETRFMETINEEGV